MSVEVPTQPISTEAEGVESGAEATLSAQTRPDVISQRVVQNAADVEVQQFNVDFVRRKDMVKEVVAGNLESGKVEQLTDFWRSVDRYSSYVTQELADTELATYIQDPANHQRISRIRKEISSGGGIQRAVFEPLLSTMEGSDTEAGIHATEALSALMIGSLRTEGGTKTPSLGESLKSWDELSQSEKVLMRTAQLMQAAALTARVRQGIVEGDSSAKIAEMKAMLASDDLPKQSTSSESTPVSEIADKLSEALDEAEREAKASPELNGQTQEKLFGREKALSSEDLRATEQRLAQLYKEGSYEDLAKELAHLKRAKITLSEKTQEKVFAKLRSHIESVQGSGKPRMFTKYLANLKAAGVVDVIGGQEHAAVQRAMESVYADQNPSNQASQVFAQAKYLGVDVDKDKCVDVLVRELQHLGGEGNETLRAARLARAKYLGVQGDSRIDQMKRQAKNPLSAELGARAAKGQWNRFAPLSGFYASVYGVQELPERTVDGMLQFAKSIRRKAGEGAVVLNRYVGELAELTRQVKRQERKDDQAFSGFTNSFEGPDADAGALRALFEHIDREASAASTEAQAVGQAMADADGGPDSSPEEYLRGLQGKKNETAARQPEKSDEEALQDLYDHIGRQEQSAKEVPEEIQNITAPSTEPTVEEHLAQLRDQEVAAQKNEQLSVQEMAASIRARQQEGGQSEGFRNESELAQRVRQEREKKRAARPWWKKLLRIE